MIRIVRGFLVVASAAALLGGCSSAGAPATGAGGNTERTGSVGLDLVLAPGVVLDSLMYTIHNPVALAGGDVTGTVDVSHSQVARFVIGALPSSDWYTIRLTGMTEDGLACVGDVTPFSIGAGHTTDVAANLVCGSATADTPDSGSARVSTTVTLLDAGSPCPMLVNLGAQPSEVDVGGSVQLVAVASPMDADLSWATTGSAGMLDGVSGSNRTFTCTSPGTATITATATLPGSGCVGAASVDVTCDAPAGTPLSCATGNLGLGGVGLPPGTTATASSGSNVTLGGPLGVNWAANNWTGWIQLAFPTPIALDGLALNAISAPTTEETYTLTGFLQGASIPLGTYTATVSTGGLAVSVPPMIFPAGTFDGLRIDVNGELSWVSVDAVSLLTADCPAGPGGIYEIGTGVLLDGGAPPDAGAGDDAAGASMDAGEAADSMAMTDATEGPDATVTTCELPPFPSFGTADLTGTVAMLAPGGNPCTTFGAPVPAQGTVTFSIGTSGCSFIYADSSGRQFESNLNLSSSTGDTVTCSFATGSGQVPSQVYASCPELSFHQDGLDANVSISVNRSTGAVSISRLCAWSDAVCINPNPYDTNFGAATSFQLSGSVTCPDGGTAGVVQCGSESCPAGFVCCSTQVGAGMAVSTCQAGSCP